MNQVTLREIGTMSLAPLVKAVRRLRLKLALRDCDRLLHHLAAQRAHDNYLESQTHRRQAMLRANLAHLERAK